MDTTSQRPKVCVERVTNSSTGDITHCNVLVGSQVFKAEFTESSTSLCDRIYEETGVSLTVSESMAVTHASRAQMEREASRLEMVLNSQPFGAVADIGISMLFWLTTSNQLIWVESIDLNQSSPNDVHQRHIEDVGEIDTEELNEVSVSIRKWLKSPIFLNGDQDWLKACEIQLV